MNTQGPNPNWKLISGLILAVISLGAYVFLKTSKVDTAELLLFIGPLVTYLLIGGKVEHETNKQNEVLAKIDKQTNGVLRQVIREEIAKALDDRDNQGKLF